jgi:hypothetical protein
MSKSNPGFGLNSFKPVFDEHKSEIQFALARNVSQPFAYGGGNAFWYRITQLERFQVRPHDVGHAADFRGGPEFVHRALHKNL